MRPGNKSGNNKLRKTTPINGKSSSESKPKRSRFASGDLDELYGGNLEVRNNDGFLAAPKKRFIMMSGEILDRDADPERPKGPNTRLSQIVPQSYYNPGSLSHKITKRDHSLPLDSSPKLQAARNTKKIEEICSSTGDSSDQGRPRPKTKNPYKKFHCTNSRQFMQESFYLPKNYRKLNQSSTDKTLPVSKQDLSQAWSKNSKRYNLIFKKAVVPANRLTSSLQHSRIDFLHISMPKNWSDPNWIQKQNRGVPNYSDICLNQKNSSCDHDSVGSDDNTDNALVMRQVSNQLGVSHDFSQPTGVHPYSLTES
jgi:hypothetical protein